MKSIPHTSKGSTTKFLTVASLASYQCYCVADRHHIPYKIVQHLGIACSNIDRTGGLCGRFFVRYSALHSEVGDRISVHCSVLAPEYTCEACHLGLYEKDMGLPAAGGATAVVSPSVLAITKCTPPDPRNAHIWMWSSFVRPLSETKPFAFLNFSTVQPLESHRVSSASIRRPARLTVTGTTSPPCSFP